MKPVTGVKPARRGKSTGPWEPTCIFCHTKLPDVANLAEHIVATPTTVGQDGWPAGVLLRICAKDCPELPSTYFAGMRTSVLESIGGSRART